jgi:sulfate adenylyltransferase subunit 1
MDNYLKVVVAGAVDSGKSTLIGRLLYESGSLHRGAANDVGNSCRILGRDFEFAYLLDSFEEERRGELTIDTTQVFCKSSNGKGFIFIDVPGHRELIKNMLCGVTYADIAVLVMDVLKPVEEQTKLHALILKLLGIKNIVLVLNKIDKSNFKESAFSESKIIIDDFFRRVGLDFEYCIPVSAKDGCNLMHRSKETPWYQGMPLFKALNMYSGIPVDNHFCFSTQDIYNINGQEIAVGPIISGKVTKGDKVKVLPSNRKSQIRIIRSFNKNKSKAAVPESVGLILDNMENIIRGCIITNSSILKAATEIKAKIFCLANLTVGQKVKLRCLNQDVSGRIDKINRIWELEDQSHSPEILLENDAYFAETLITTDKPLITEQFKGSNSLGRFVIEDDREICAIGIIS